LAVLFDRAAAREPARRAGGHVSSCSVHVKQFPAGNRRKTHILSGFDPDEIFNNSDSPA
jgi:hypothetical protein